MKQIGGSIYRGIDVELKISNGKLEKSFENVVAEHEWLLIENIDMQDRNSIGESILMLLVDIDIFLLDRKIDDRLVWCLNDINGGLSYFGEAWVEGKEVKITASGKRFNSKLLIRWYDDGTNIEEIEEFKKIAHWKNIEKIRQEYRKLEYVDGCRRIVINNGPKKKRVEEKEKLDLELDLDKYYDWSFQTMKI
ncbi:MAG: hypothetical protein IKY94_15465 [Lachnospiraceae bacterium]|nr:hypothetical protein [Lachnospiraceae bacterium]